MPEIKIDESKLREEPGFLVKMKNAFLGIVYGAVLIQIIIWVFRMGISIVLVYNQLWFISIMVLCAILGWLFGEDFHGWLRNKMSSWDLWH